MKVWVRRACWTGADFISGKALGRELELVPRRSAVYIGGHFCWIVGVVRQDLKIDEQA